MADVEVDPVSKTFGEVYKKFGHKDRQGNFLFQRVAKKAGVENIGQQDLAVARQWFRDQAVSQSQVSQNRMMKTAGNFETMNNLSINSIGKLYMYSYDPKHKKTLPYYDVWPLIFPIEFYGNSMLGINIHYLPPQRRAELLNALYDTLNNDKMNKTTKLKISYQILKSSSNLSLFKPCVKKYLFSHVKSQFHYIKPDFWDYAVMLPTAKFIKASEEQVWADSMKKV